jgi:soluble lytic murein transglycosylase-like protein
MWALLPRLGASLLLTIVAPLASAAPPAGNTSHSPWLQAATKHGLEPIDLYAVALQESRRFCTDGKLRPWPWTLNTPSEGALYFKDYSSAVAKLKALIAAGITNVDIGVMQVNWGYHRHRVRDAAELLRPDRNIDIAAQILREHLDEYNGDLRTAFARYHSGRTERGVPYAAQVLAILERLREFDDVKLALSK